MGGCVATGHVSLLPPSKLDEDYLYMAYADIMAKVSSCLCPASTPSSPDAAATNGRGSWRVDRASAFLTHQLMLLLRAATWRRAGKMAKKEVKKRKWRCPLR